MTTQPRPHQEEPNEPEPVIVSHDPEEALRRARPLPKDFGIDDLTPAEAAAFLAAIAEL